MKANLIMRKIDKYKPAVTNNILLFLAGIVWLSVGIMLVYLAYTWLSASSNSNVYLFALAGVTVALLAHHFGFLKIADKNLRRILPMKGKKCLFSFITWKSYLLIAVMITMGITLRHSAIPKPYLAIIYIGVGLGLILSSVRYFRTYIREVKRQ